MKKSITLLGMSTLFISPLISTSAFADFEIYGKANVGIINTDVDSADNAVTELKSFASRIGIKGNTELTEGLDAIYKWETEVDLTGSNTNGDDGLLKARNQYIGLSGGLGTLIGGIHDTPMKQAEGKIDLFSDIIDIARIGDPYMDTQEREKDFLGYYSPKFSNLQFKLATMPGKGKELGDAFSTALVYGDKSLKKTPFFGAIAYDSGVDSSEDSSAIRVSGSTKLAGVTLGAIYEVADTDETGSEEQSRYVMSGAYKIGGKNTLKLQYAASDDANNGSKDIEGSTDLTLGLDHKLAKSTSLYGVINSAENVKGTKGNDETNIIFGIVHKFKF